MALSPQDLALTSDELMTVDEHEKQIDKALRNNFVEGALQIRLVFSDHPNGLQAPKTLRVYNELVRRYLKAGWKEIEREFSAMVFKK